MGETIRTGDVVEVEPVSAPQLWRGDIVLFERHGRLVAHRLIGTVSDAGLTCLLFRGDNHNGSDGVVPTQAVLGRVSHVERHIPNLVRALGRRVFGLFSN